MPFICFHNSILRFNQIFRKCFKFSLFQSGTEFWFGQKSDQMAIRDRRYALILD